VVMLLMLLVLLMLLLLLLLLSMLLLWLLLVMFELVITWPHPLAAMPTEHVVIGLPLASAPTIAAARASAAVGAVAQALILRALYSTFDLPGFALIRLDVRQVLFEAIRDLLLGSASLVHDGLGSCLFYGW